jgi:hypothetical protein
MSKDIQDAITACLLARSWTTAIQIAYDSNVSECCFCGRAVYCMFIVYQERHEQHVMAPVMQTDKVASGIVNAPVCLQCYNDAPWDDYPYWARIKQPIEGILGAITACVPAKYWASNNG